MTDDIFQGKGFDTQDFTPEERAKIRHLYFVLNDKYREIDDEVLITIHDGIALIKAVRILSTVIKIGAPVAGVGIAIGALMRTQGWL